jgi:hypothetical protein
MSTSRSSNMLPWHFSQVYIWTLHGLIRLAVREKVICRPCDIRQVTVNLHLVGGVQKNWRWKIPLEATMWIKGKNEQSRDEWIKPFKKEGQFTIAKVEKLQNEYSDYRSVEARVYAWVTWEWTMNWMKLDHWLTDELSWIIGYFMVHMTGSLSCNIRYGIHIIKKYVVFF